jgi:hypothetical protein
MLNTWEYFLVDATSQPQLSIELAALGREGWEAVGITYAADHYVVLLKRPRSAAEAIAPAAAELEVMLDVPAVAPSLERPDDARAQNSEF